MANAVRGMTSSRYKKSADRPGGILRAVEETSAPIALLVNDRISYANSVFCKMYGDLRNQTISDFFLPEHVEQLNWLIKGAHGEVDKIVLPLKDNIESDYAGKELMVQIWPIDDNFCLLSLRPDYSHNRLADVDELTGLPNRRKALMLLDIEKSRVNRAHDFCLTLCDIDHFKIVNDTHGHDIGDKVLQHVAGVMKAGLREGDWVARWGGEEFMIFTAESDLITGIQPVERIRSKLETSDYIGPPKLRVTMSFGLVSSTGRYNLHTLINKADMLLYEAKHSGRNRIKWESSDEVIWVADNIKKAAVSGKLTAAYASIYDLQGSVVAQQITPYLAGYDDYETDKMIYAIDRLHQQTLLDSAMMDAVNRDLTEPGGALYFFPLRRQSFDARKKDMDDFLSRHPGMGVCLDAGAMPSMQLIEQLPPDRKLALFNYNPKTSPSYLLGLPQLTHIIFSSAKGADGILALLKGKVSCYLQYRHPIDEYDKQYLASEGFHGWMVVPQDEQHSGAESDN